MINQIKTRENDFKEQLQKTEREIMSSFAFKRNMAFGTSAHSSLSETMQLRGDHVEISYLTEFNGKDLDNLKQKMRRINPQFIDEAQFMRDVQVIIDENYLNYHFFTMFYDEKAFSMTIWIR